MRICIQVDNCKSGKTLQNPPDPQLFKGRLEMLKSASKLVPAAYKVQSSVFIFSQTQFVDKKRNPRPCFGWCINWSHKKYVFTWEAANSLGPYPQHCLRQESGVRRDDFIDLFVDAMQQNPEKKEEEEDQADFDKAALPTAGNPTQGPSVAFVRASLIGMKMAFFSFKVQFVSPYKAFNLIS